MMKNAEEMKLLMSFNPKERQFVIDAVKELAYKNWGQIYRTLSADSYKEWDFIDYLKALKKFLELKGFKVSNVYPFYTDKIRIAW